MGKAKQLLPLGDRPAIVRCLESIRRAGIDDIVAVVGPKDGKTGDEIIEAIKEFPVTVVRNEVPEADMSQSLRFGLRNVRAAASGVFVCLADQPLVKAETLMSMYLQHLEKPGMIILPVYHGKKGHPPLLPREIAAELDVLPTLRDLIGKHSREVYRLEVIDEGVVIDMDTREDYQRILERFSECGRA